MGRAKTVRRSGKGTSLAFMSFTMAPQCAHIPLLTTLVASSLPGAAKGAKKSVGEESEDDRVDREEQGVCACSQNW